jgi:hypothetical protein
MQLVDQGEAVIYFVKNATAVKVKPQFLPARFFLSR